MRAFKIIAVSSQDHIFYVFACSLEHAIKTFHTKRGLRIKSVEDLTASVNATPLISCEVINELVAGDREHCHV